MLKLFGSKKGRQAERIFIYVSLSVQNHNSREGGICLNLGPLTDRND